jgi:hypothetical protein
MIFWTTWILGILLGFVCLGAAIDEPQFQKFWLCCSYFSMASGVIGSLIGTSI